jgi:hypothetical protein
MKQLLLALFLLACPVQAQAGQVTIYQGGQELVFAFSGPIEWLDKDGNAASEKAAVTVRFYGTRNGRTGHWRFSLLNCGIMVEEADGNE